MSHSWIVHKFGGTSVAGAERYQAVARVLEGERSADPAFAQAIVVSAMSKVTDALIELTELARKRDESYGARLTELEERHRKASRELLPREDIRREVDEALVRECGEIREVLRGLFLSRAASERTVELISGHGELWSARLLDGWLRCQGRRSRWLDAREVLVVEPGEGAVQVDWEVSGKRLAKWLGEVPTSKEETLVITGFIASSADGVPTTLKRNGSDYSASIFGKLLGAGKIVIWTDVDGVLSADPRLVPEAEVLEDLSYDEATELAYFGAKVVHPSTMAPAIETRIPIWIRNTFRPEAGGTVIRDQSSSTRPVKGFATIEDIALLNVEGTGMVGVPGVANRLFGALKEVGVSVVLISQASSEHSICFAVPEGHAARAKAAVEKAFFAELHHGQIQRVETVTGCSILAAVGDNMVHQPGIAGKLFSALGRAGVSIRAIAQGSSERNISVVLDRADAVRGLRAAHAGFYLSHHTLSVGVVGVGGIGKELLRQLAEVAPRLKLEKGVDVRVRAVSDSRKMLLSDVGCNPEGAAAQVKASGEPLDLVRLAEHVQAPHLPHAVLIDCTASSDVSARYAGWLARGIHVISPNKKANAASLEEYRALRKAMTARHARFLYETNVGAGLPVIQTLRDLVLTGDGLLRIEGILSGTLSFLFNSYDGKRAFSEIVLEAKSRGYTEPDPRDDLSGMDVCRKLVILAREAGLALEVSDVKVESLVPEPLRTVSTEEFLRRLPELDAPMAERHRAAVAAGQVLKYVGFVEFQGERPSAGVSLLSVPSTHAFARLSGTDNCVAFRTRRYDRQPLIVQGPGAGPEVTAAGVFGDLLRLASSLGADL